MRQNKINIILCLIAFSSVSYAQFEFEDDFEEYIAGHQLACQNPIDWTTWNNMPCDPLQDPYVSNNFSHSWPNSVSITSYNDLIKPLGNFSTGRNHITFDVYLSFSLFFKTRDSLKQQSLAGTRNPVYNIHSS